MTLIVQKYGGSSVATPEKIKNVARRIISTKEAGNCVVAVISAMGSTTDGLIKLANQVSSNPPEREIDQLISTGEQISVAVMAMAISDMGHEAISMTGAQAGFETDSAHTKAKIMTIKPGKIVEELKNGKIVIVAGFQGIDVCENVTTLGRGGSDTTAVALAAVLGADACEIYTDVDGVYTADPRIVPNARKIDEIDYEEMLEMASLGAKVMQSRSIEFASKYGVRIHVRSSFKQDEGTFIVKEAKSMMEKVVIRGVTVDKEQAKVTILHVPDRPGIAAAIFKALAGKNINLHMILQNVSEEGYTDVSFTVMKADLKKARAITESILAEIGARSVTIDDDIAQVSVVGTGMKSHSGIAADMFGTLAREKINIEMISTSEIKISCVVKSSDSSKAGSMSLRSIRTRRKLAQPGYTARPCRPEIEAARRWRCSIT